MNAAEQMEVLKWLDLERQTVIYPGVTRFSGSGVVKDLSLDGESCEIVYSCCSESEVDRIIAQQIQTARSERCELEWKVYGHDLPQCLGERLIAAGFEAGEQEAFMVFSTSDDTLDCFGVCQSDIRKAASKEDLYDVQRIFEDVYGRSCEKQIAEYAFMLENHPNNMSIYIAYVEGEPAACGRVYFHESSRFAALYGGQTRERYRRRGIFTQIVAARIREAISRGIANVCVDALPTSEPILKKLGFEKVTDTRPFCYSV